jgi:hypothetical protein
MNESTPSRTTPPQAARNPRRWLGVKRVNGASPHRKGTDEISLSIPVQLDLRLDFDPWLTADLQPQVVTNRHPIELQRVANPAERDLCRVQLPCGRGNPLQALAITWKVRGNANARRDARTQRVDPCGLPIDVTDQPVRGDVRHADPERVAVALRIQVANEDSLDRRQSGPWVVLAARSTIHDFRVHARPADVLPHLVDDEHIHIARQSWHPGLRQREVLFVALLHAVGRHGIELCGVVLCIFDNRQATEHFPRLQDTSAHRADHMLEAETLRVSVVLLRAGKLSQPDRHHLHEAAFDPAIEGRVPLDARDDHHRVGTVRRGVHEYFDPILRHAERYDLGTTVDGAAH